MMRGLRGRSVRRPFPGGDKDWHHSCRRSVSLSEGGFRVDGISGGSFATSAVTHPPRVSTQELAPRF